MNQDQVVSVGAILLLAIMTTVWLLKRARLHRARKWAVAVGHVESTAVTLKSGGGQPGSAAYYAELKYSYRVQEESHFGILRRRFMLKGRADSWVSEFSNSTELKVRYNPAKIKDSVVLESEQVSSGSMSLHPCLALLAPLLWMVCGAAHAQAPSDYTNDLPSVQRVQSEIKGSDATDTLARQVAVFTYLQSYIERIKYARTVRGPYTASEQEKRNAYSLAAYQISQNYAKTHTADEAAAFERLHGQYELKPDFYADWSKRLIGPQAVAATAAAQSEYAASGKRFHDKIQQDLNPQPQSGGANSILGPHAPVSLNAQGLSNDPTAVATRRCLELGGDSAACVGKGFMGGLMDMFVSGAGLGELTGPGPAGPFLSGSFGNSSGTSLAFGSSDVSLNKCGVLSDDSYPYSLSKTSSLQVTIATEPRPILLTMRSDGSLIGPGPVTIEGRIITGYHEETVRHYSGDYLTGASTTRTPIYAPRTDRCSVGSLAPPPTPRPAPASTQESGGLVGALTGFLGTLAPGDLPGIRMQGKYSSSSGMLLEFAGDAVTLDCGQAHAKAPYTVENAPGQFLVHVQNGDGPFTLAVVSDSTLRGTGSTTVHGRLVTGMNGDDVTFAPRSENCSIGVFSPQNGANSRFATTSPAGAPAPAATAPAGAAPVSAGSSAKIKLSVTSSFPGGTNPLAGRPVMLMSDRFDDALRKSGAPVPADVTPGKALQAYAANCLPPKNCGTISTAMKTYYVGRAVFDSNGKVVMDAAVQPGAYFVFSSANSSGAAMVWDLPIEIKSSGNEITLETSNAEVIR